MHGYQIWVALPKELEEMEPRLDFIPADQLPKWEGKGLSFKLVAGKGFGKESPLKGYSDLFMVDIYANEAAKLDLQDHLRGDAA